uniref:Uncharacterized protein n=1 Tax=Conchiformibius kuhniae TaxID=211502 RepID=A0A8T9MTI0_9NEIS|nr:hypothetical protein LVJ77_08775 [Conchiformibius kuhniae]
MNNNIPQVKTVKLLFVAMDERQQAMFKMAFKMHSTTTYQVIGTDSSERPEMVIVDGDGRWARRCGKRLPKPIIRKAWWCSFPNARR